MDKQTKIILAIIGGIILVMFLVSKFSGGKPKDATSPEYNNTEETTETDDTTKTEEENAVTTEEPTTSPTSKVEETAKPSITPDDNGEMPDNYVDPSSNTKEDEIINRDDEDYYSDTDDGYFSFDKEEDPSTGTDIGG